MCAFIICELVYMVDILILCACIWVLLTNASASCGGSKFVAKLQRNFKFCPVHVSMNADGRLSHALPNYKVKVQIVGMYRAKIENFAANFLSRRRSIRQ